MSIENAIGASPKQLFVTSLTETSTMDLEGVGTIRTDQGGRAYKWVQNKHTAALTVGQAAFHSFANGAAFDNLVYDGATADLGAMAGIVMAASLAVDSYGWVQALGYNASVAVIAYQAATALAAGGWLIGTDSLATLTKGVAMGTAPSYKRGVIALEGLASTINTATAIKGYVYCL
jgi:hypothetical protein